MKINISDNKLSLLLKEHFHKKNISQASIRDFRSWLEKYATELGKDERKGEFLDVWILDMLKHFHNG